MRSRVTQRLKEMVPTFRGLPYDKEIRIPVEWIKHDETKTREIDQGHVDGIAASFLTKGQQQPVKVRPVGDWLVVTYGEHRVEACKVLTNRRLAIKRLPIGVIMGVIERTDEYSALELKITENAQRNAFVNPWEEGKIMVKLLSEKYGNNLDALSEALGKSNAYARERIEVYHRLAKELVPFIGKGLTIQNAIALSKIEREKDQLDLANNILRSRSQNFARSESDKFNRFFGVGGGFHGKIRVKVTHACPVQGCGHVHSMPDVTVVVDE